eukprot:m.420099 g.420099  ORF g.420099 m.420099 type:complete len:115 (-) comp56629_c0_seq49:516-860(-)
MTNRTKLLLTLRRSRFGFVFFCLHRRIVQLVTHHVVCIMIPPDECACLLSCSLVAQSAEDPRRHKGGYWSEREYMVALLCHSGATVDARNKVCVVAVCCLDQCSKRLDRPSELW